MRAFACALAISLAFGGPIWAAPKRVASLKLCTDEIVMMLADQRQIASVTYLAQQPLETPLWKQARRYGKNDGSLLSVSKYSPDLIFDMGGGGRDARRIAKALKLRLIIFPYPQSLREVKAMIRTIAAELGRQAAGARLIGRIERMEREKPTVALDSIWLGGGGRSVSAHGLAADWMRLAGMRQRELRGDRVSLEQLLTAPPAILLRSDYRQGQYSGEQRWLLHPLAKGTRKSRTIATDGRRWTCMGPTMIDEIERLRREVKR